ncbi:MAG TPA: CRISPR-associated RAMP protein [Clostridiaceae bacterium]|nr:CRISPR-associated RAMP protein [Clostridiaceae bacterium]
MFKTLYNECRIKFLLSAQSPVCIRSGENVELDPSLSDIQFIRSMHNGEMNVVIPGSSIKGVFRNRAEKYLKGSCRVFDNSCFKRTKGIEDIKKRYVENCPACRLFGSMSLKSRIEFKDAYPLKDTVVLARRHNVGINRVTGSAMTGALYQPEVLEQGTFEVNIYMKNFFLWQLKTILQVIDDINEGFVTFGGLTSRGFGRMSADQVQLFVREYGREVAGEFFMEKELSLEEIKDKLMKISLDDKEMRKVDFNEHIL